jgi:hypothetical protein
VKKLLEYIKLSNSEHEIFKQIFTAITPSNHYAVEVGYDGIFDRDVIQDWQGLLIDQTGLPVLAPCKIESVKKFVTAENINEILERYNCPSKIDLFAIDIDGNDFHVLRALKATVPRVIITEYNASFGPEQSLAIKYNPDFKRGGNGLYHGASLAAFSKLLNARDYALVGVESNGFNAFFVNRVDCVGKLRELSAAEAWKPHSGRDQSWQAQFELFRMMEFEQV